MHVTLRRHYPLLVALLLMTALLVWGLGDQRVVAFASKGSGEAAATAAASIANVSNDVALFDDTLVHSIQILVSEADYQQMITTYKETGEKDYIHADVIIDGVRINNVGLRLKGNASLRSALGQDGGQRGMDGGQPFDRGAAPAADGERPAWPEGQAPAQGEPRFRPPQEGAQEGQWQEGQPPDPADMPQWPGAEAPPEEGAGGQAAMPFGGAPWDQTNGEETLLPYMIKFDEFVSGQRYQGYKLLAIRTYGASYDAAMLQEPVTNSIFRAAGLPATQTAYTGLRLNEGEERLYTLSEAIDETYIAQHFPSASGVLYKAELGANLTYQGEDPSAYATRFTQQTRVNDADLAPLIAFTRFLSESDDATFVHELPSYIDVDALAGYLAANNLLVNTDSLAGMSNNYYLYYDENDRRFTLLMWDANESLGKLTRGAQAASYDLYYTGQQGAGPRLGGANTLATRFLADPTFRALYEHKLQEIYQQAFVSGGAVAQVEQYATLVRAANEERSLVAPESYEAAVASVLDFIAQRSEYLASTELLGGLQEVAAR
ncbi:MAG: hypothetical protein GX601_15355 [Anaerolineales bacterium]|nr:hypothetical protein [Anaerolineales bacterium]